MNSMLGQVNMMPRTHRGSLVLQLRNRFKRSILRLALIWTIGLFDLSISLPYRAFPGRIGSA